jgi:hypothetical protein
MFPMLEDFVFSAPWLL